MTLNTKYVYLFVRFCFGLPVANEPAILSVITLNTMISTLHTNLVFISILQLNKQSFQTEIMISPL